MKKEPRMEPWRTPNGKEEEKNKNCLKRLQMFYCRNRKIFIEENNQRYQQTFRVFEAVESGRWCQRPRSKNGERGR